MKEKLTWAFLEKDSPAFRFENFEQGEVARSECYLSLAS